MEFSLLSTRNARGGAASKMSTPSKMKTPLRSELPEVGINGVFVIILYKPGRL